ncbi:MAG: hypothetical protein RUDDFDWM_000794 [Candidatus Fervidibacterota bacterium]
MEMLARLQSAALIGIDAYIVQVEVDILPGMPSIKVVGLPDRAVTESVERIRSAIRNSQYELPRRPITVNLAPADTKKEGAAFDLPIALGILMASGQINVRSLDDFVIVGELSLDGSLRPVNGVLSIAMGARDAGIKALVVPFQNACEAAVVREVDVYAVKSLHEAAMVVTNPQSFQPHPKTEFEGEFVLGEHDVDFSEVKGQEHAKRALEIAAAGGHNVLMIGPPGSGKTMLARRLPTILPPMSVEEMLEVTKIYSVAGLLPRDKGLITTRPFRAPHHTISNAGLIGGGSIPKPGEVSLAHNGVLFLDEFPEFHRDTLEVLRQPIEDGEVTITRAAHTITFPARFTLIAAMNPCPCGYATDMTRRCTCTESQIRRYRMRISGPLVDRIDIHIEVPKLRPDEILEPSQSETSAQIRERVVRARQIQLERFADSGIFCNAHMQQKHMRQFCIMTEGAKQILKRAIESLGFSARGSDRILKVARTIADLCGSELIREEHIAEAIQYRALDRELFV